MKRKTENIESWTLFWVCGKYKKKKDENSGLHSHYFFAGCREKDNFYTKDDLFSP